MKTAGRVGELFHVDPVLVLQEADAFVWAVRVAAYNVVQQDRKDAATRSQQQRVGGSIRRPRKA